ncbi:MAG: ArsR family transcriptional regulator [Culturomica sp.]|nr:ArsR family transcriptional regulator [Culturomica sp.]
MKFFLNPSVKAYLRGLSDEFGESTNAIRLELNHLEEAGLLYAEADRNRKVYHANAHHPLFDDIRSLVLKHSGITQIIEKVVSRIGDIYRVWVRGSFAEGKDSDTVDIVVVCATIDKDYFATLITKAENLIRRKVTYLFITPEEEEEFLVDNEKLLLIWEK